MRLKRDTTTLDGDCRCRSHSHCSCRKAQARPIPTNPKLKQMVRSEKKNTHKHLCSRTRMEQHFDRHLKPFGTLGEEEDENLFIHCSLLVFFVVHSFFPYPTRKKPISRVARTFYFHQQTSCLCLRQKN